MRLLSLIALSSYIRPAKAPLSDIDPHKPAVHAPNVHVASKMKSVSTLLLLATAISPALSQPHAAAINDSPEPAPLAMRADLVPFVCREANALITEQLAEIAQMQKKKYPVPPDLAGYFYAVAHGRQLLGCPSEPLLNPKARAMSIPQSLTSSSEPAIYEGDSAGLKKACAVVYKQTEEVMDQMIVLKDNNIGIPPFLAGWFSVIKDADKYLQCGSGTANMTVTSSTEERQS